MSSLNFLRFPRELRDMIYVDYVTVAGGLIYHSRSRTLKPAAAAERPFELQRTCKQVAEEMKGLVLMHNTITFSTIDCLREDAYRFHMLLDDFVFL
ncbi:Uu.00g033450.m01.CDS01 [Anthostomella pinea]|uniref:Uu.00g033450.m01.CDS01 n=1 Tax=Anthostomella pinea TaxID=933095 RepID=A0AAI8YD98_9PEZI|nr:Uu.00g033450.m01.CDS01 [Anthostomella pinea]